MKTNLLFSILIMFVVVCLLPICANGLVLSNSPGDTNVPVWDSNNLPPPGPIPYPYQYCMVAHWKLDETSGTIAQDSSGGGNTGTLINGPVWTAGKIGGALSFNGTQAVYIDGSAGYSSPLNIYNTNMTISAWIKPGPNACTIVARAKPNYITYNLYVDGGKVGINTYKSPVHWNLLTGKILDPNNWYHIIAVLDRDNDTGIIYVNGIERARSIQMTVDPPSCDAPTKIGCRNNTSDYTFTGLIDDVRIYNCALDANDVKELYTGKIHSIEITGPNSVPEESDTQYQAIGHYENGSSKNITADANLTVAPDKFAAIDSNGMLATERLYRLKENCTIYADYKGVSGSKLVAIYPVCGGIECTVPQLLKRNVGDIIKIKQDIRKDLAYAEGIEWASLTLQLQTSAKPQYKGWSKARLPMLAAISYELWADQEIDKSITSLKSADDIMK